ncbi:uncharacterized protein LOC107265074 [Cephus cinctus]|uniref:Uncharacterized protein LOC107265074 n=1 Tax=Cephus cinctus TaxID=211228 RepID=A0AAJ7FFQ2_CEPCN|nr:uncharacterized protein LOC107265074 [Cephus cinctus]XP_015589561.1 uncharacterized protein LOC107265074 [Cephus cinctus]XP_015589562.1 uncharacterized protein LOC107265074 [Cephus cinctus]
MKKRGATDSKGNKNQQEKSKKDEENKLELAPLDDDSHNQGFGEWLRSSDGVDMMRLFVLANSLVVFVTMAWPNMQEAVNIIRDMFMGEEE